MARETKTEFEVEEKEREITYCDDCGISEDNCEDMIEIPVNPDYHSKTEWEVVKTFGDEWDAQEFIQRKNKGEFRKGEIQVPGGSQEVYRAQKTRQVFLNNAPLTMDFCAKCFSKKYDVDVEKYKDIEIGVSSSQVDINVEKEDFFHDGLYTPLLFVSLWPITVALFIIDGAINGFSTDIGRMFITATIGTLLYTSLFFILFL